MRALGFLTSKEGPWRVIMGSVHLRGVAFSGQNHRQHFLAERDKPVMLRKRQCAGASSVLSKLLGGKQGQAGIGSGEETAPPQKAPQERPSAVGGW